MVLHKRAFVPNRATSPHQGLSISGISSSKDTLRSILNKEKLPGGAVHCNNKGRTMCLSEASGYMPDEVSAYSASVPLGGED